MSEAGQLMRIAQALEAQTLVIREAAMGLELALRDLTQAIEDASELEAEPSP